MSSFQSRESNKKRYWKVDYETLEDLLEKVEKQKLALPEFQRDFKWRKDDWFPFLHSILQNKVTGSLLLLEFGKNSIQFAPRGLERGPGLKQESLEQLLLDGQQRTTTLWHAFAGGFKVGNNKVPFSLSVDVEKLLAEKIFLQEHLNIEHKVGATPEEQAEQHRLELATMIDDDLRGRWEDEFVKTDFVKKFGWDARQLAHEMSDRIVLYSDLRSYTFPSTELEKETPPGVIVDIFQDINRRGKRLDEFELMNARCFNEFEKNSKNRYSLKNHWTAAFKKTHFLKKIGFTESDGLLPLYLITCALKRATDELGSLPIGADAVLSMDPTFVTGAKIGSEDCSLETAVDALEKAAKFLYEKCGVLSGILLPQDMMILPIADQYFLESKQRRALSEDHLKRWFWISGLRGDFYGSTMNYVAIACTDLEAWSKNAKVIPHGVITFDKGMVKGLDLTAAKARQQDIVGKSVLSIIAAQGSLDWKKDNGTVQTRVSVDDHEIHAHHIIPEVLLKGYYKVENSTDRTIPISNFAIATKQANSELGRQSPREVKNTFGSSYSQILDLSWVPDKEFQAVKTRKSFETFCEARANKLKDKIISVLNL